MWRPDRSVRGPDRPTLRDIDSLNRVFADAFTDRYSRDGLVGVRVPQLNNLVWRYALEDAGDGSMGVLRARRHRPRDCPCARSKRVHDRRPREPIDRWRRDVVRPGDADSRR